MTSRRDGAHERALAYLNDHHVLTLATHGDDGIWAAAVFYASDAFNLYFLSAATTRHAQHIAARPRVAGTIQEDYTSWTAIRGIQLEGPARRLHGEERDAAIALYRKKFPFLITAPAAIAAALQRVDWYVLAPDLLYFVDNSRGFGHRDRIL